MTLILNSMEIKECVQFNAELIPIIEDAFKSLSLGKTVMPPILRVDIEKYHGESDVKAAYIEGLDSFAVKVASGFFNNPKLGLPSSNGLMILLDSQTGVIKSVLLDKGYLTDVRTAIAGAIASKYLSNPESSTVAIIGTGIQARMQLEALTLVRDIKNVNVWSRDIKKTHAYIEDVNKNNKLNFTAFDNTNEVVNNADILITTTPSKKPLVDYSSLPKGIHITAMGSDAEEKNELEPDIIKNCDVYVPDSQAQTSILGELNHAIKNNLIKSDMIFNDLGKIIINPELGRKNNDDITVADLTGTGVQDTAIARYAYSIAINKNLGKKVE
ncbi:MAG: cyclodeaminase [Proteobacteria bacterium]|nr:cyclodeaminase [Pseudomonadota bacterium]MDA1181061.1 cyclodeaminase [Pseudomonadota bacterium]